MAISEDLPEVPADLLAADGPQLLLPRRHSHVLLQDLLLGVLAGLYQKIIQLRYARRQI